MHEEIGQRFAQAMAEKDQQRLLALLDPAVDFHGLTPGRAWETGSATELVDEMLLGAWFEGPDQVEALEAVETGSVVDRGRVSYRLRIRNPDGSFLVEQQAYFSVENGRISWLRILCSGFRPIEA